MTETGGRNGVSIFFLFGSFEFVSRFGFRVWGQLCCPSDFLQLRDRVFAIQFRNQARTDLGGADRLALVGVRAIAETFGVHRRNHL